MIVIWAQRDDVTTDYVEWDLRKRRLPFVRINAEKPLAKARFHYHRAPRMLVGRRSIAPTSVSGVWCRWLPRTIQSWSGFGNAEQTHGNDELTEAIFGFLFNVPSNRWINHPSAELVGWNKIVQLTLAKDCGLDIPQSLLSDRVSDARAFLRRHQKSVVKPLFRGYIQRAVPADDSVIYTTRIEKLPKECASELRRVPTLFQEEIVRVADARVIVIDSRAVGIGMTAQATRHVDIRHDGFKGVEYFPLTVPRQIQSKLRKFMGRSAIRFSAFDFIIDPDQRWVFLESNPSGQWGWLEKVANGRIRDALVDALLRK